MQLLRHRYGFIANASITGCDSSSIVIIVLNSNINDTIIYYTSLIADTSISIYNGNTILGCDSLTTTIVNLIPSYRDTIVAYLCFEEYTGITTIFIDTTYLGCDSNLFNLTNLSFPEALINP